MSSSYRANKLQIRAIIEGLLGSKQIVVEEADLVWKALRSWEKSSADFSDALMGEALAARGCGKVVTFDKAAARLPGFELLA
jgi:predicted nucleic-acid-binding protein